MEGWIAAVRNGGNFDEVYPVSAPRTAENAEGLENRLTFLRKELIPKAPSEPLSSGQFHEG